jgi:hypothetical protein
MINPYFLLVLVIAWGGSVAGAFFYGEGIGRDMEIATQSREDKVAQLSRESAAEAVAKAVPLIQVKNTTIRQTLEKEIHERPVFRDCRSGPDAVRMLNDTVGAAPAASAPGTGQLPASGAAR